ncbi:MAG: AAA family ATPase [Succinivibrionaceae bacterium]|nr:AAA family ATPase [Succinivibrionaceae bacterium]
MPVISICSPKGGVGKTTLTSNLAYVFAKAGTKVVAIDLDPQNAMRLYFGQPLQDDRGFISKIETDPNADWVDALINVDRNLFVLPFGKSRQAQRLILDAKLAEEGYLRDRQSTIFCNPDILVLADFPPGYSVALKALSEVTDLTLVPLIADAASISQFSMLQNDELLEGPLNHRLGYYIVLNMVDNRIKLNREIQEFATHNMSEHLLGMVHADTSVVEAAALQQPVAEFNHNSSAAFDIEVLAKKLATILGFEVKQGTILINPLRDQ